jgi:NAD(P)-dependent dehydrogenase (short-subunit alcohol dehydrogenase family)
LQSAECDTAYDQQDRIRQRDDSECGDGRRLHGAPFVRLQLYGFENFPVHHFFRSGCAKIESMVAYLASPEAGFVTGASLTIDGGFAA